MAVATSAIAHAIAADYAAAHGGAWAALLVIAACTALVSAYMQHREEREPTVFHAASPLE